MPGNLNAHEHPAFRTRFQLKRLIATVECFEARSQVCEANAGAVFWYNSREGNLISPKQQRSRLVRGACVCRTIHVNGFFRKADAIVFDGHHQLSIPAICSNAQEAAMLGRLNAVSDG